MKNLAFHSLLRWKDNYTTNSHYLTYNFSLKGWEDVILELDMATHLGYQGGGYWLLRKDESNISYSS